MALLSTVSVGRVGIRPARRAAPSTSLPTGQLAVLVAWAVVAPLAAVRWFPLGGVRRRLLRPA